MTTVAVLSSLGKSEISSLIKLRCDRICNTIAKIPLGREKSLFHNLYCDIGTSCAEVQKLFLSKSSVNTENIINSSLDSLLRRQSLVLETFSECCYRIPKAQRKDIAVELEQFLKEYSSISLIFDRIIELYSKNNQYFIKKSNVVELLTAARFHAVHLAEHQEGWSPSIEISCSLPVDHQSTLCIPHRYSFVMEEVMKNALHSTISLSKRQNSKLSLHSSREDLTDLTPSINVSIDDLEATDSTQPFFRLWVIDKGEGIAEDQLSSCFSFLHSTSRNIG